MFLVYGQIGSTADFIDKAATASSVSRRPYAIRCGVGPEVPSRQWLYDVLTRIRA